MNRKTLLSMLMVFVLLFLSGCDGDLLSDKRRLQAINEAGAAYGLEFGEARGDIPDMPDGALLLIDADERGKVVTEVFFEDSLMLKKYAESGIAEGFSYFISEEHRTVVFIGGIYRLEEDPSLSEMYEYIRAPLKVELVLSIKALCLWTKEDADSFFIRYRSGMHYPPDLDAYALGEYLFEETHNPESPYYGVNEETTEAVIDEIIYNSLRETQSLHSSADFPIVAIGNNVDGAMLSEDTWMVYCIQYPYAGIEYRTTTRNIMDYICDKFLFLLDHHFKASEID